MGIINKAGRKKCLRMYWCVLKEFIIKGIHYVNVLIFQKKFFFEVLTQIKLSSGKSKDFFKVIDNHLYYVYKIDKNRLSVLQ